MTNCETVRKLRSTAVRRTSTLYLKVTPRYGDARNVDDLLVAISAAQLFTADLEPGEMSA